MPRKLAPPAYKRDVAMLALLLGATLKETCFIADVSINSRLRWRRLGDMPDGCDIAKRMERIRNSLNKWASDNETA